MVDSILVHDPATHIAQANAVIALLRPGSTEESGFAGYTRNVVKPALWTVQTLLEQAQAMCKVDLAHQHLQQAASVVALLQPGEPDDEDSGYLGFTQGTVETSLWLVADLLDQAQAAVEAA